jgi:hypothetical protein
MPQMLLIILAGALVVGLITLVLWLLGYFETPAVNGGWGEWGACFMDNGKPTQLRRCNNPSPANGGLACTGLASKPCNMEWACVDGMSSPLRVNENGDVECLSIDGRNCMWSGKCDMTLKNIPDNVNPLACGASTKSLWGTDGYSDPKHWCAKGRAFFK